jgi:hypothetical protein
VPRSSPAPRETPPRRAAGRRPPSPRAAARARPPAPHARGRRRRKNFVERHAAAVVAGIVAATLALALVWWAATRVAALLAPAQVALMEHLLKDAPHLSPGRLAAELVPIERVPGEVRQAIRHAAAEVGVDAGYLAAVAARESRFDPAARASGTSAAGLYQFTAGTWLRALKLFGTRHGLAAEAARIGIGPDGDIVLPDERTRARLLALRDDPRLAALMAAELGRDNQARLERLLGRAVTPAETYIAHFLGLAPAAQMIEAAAARPHLRGARLLPAAAASNPGIFRPEGEAASVGAIVGAIRDYFDREAPRFARI